VIKGFIGFMRSRIECFKRTGTSTRDPCMVSYDRNDYSRDFLSQENVRIALEGDHG
jgi:hypothetical protein